MKVRDLKQQATEALLAYLEDISFVQDVETVNQVTEQLSGASRPDSLIKLVLSEGEQILLLVVKNSGQPRLAREAANHIFRYREAYPDAYGVFVAPYISPRADAICREEGIGYIDLAGNCRLSFGQVYIKREGQPNPFIHKRDLRSLYSPKAERVLRVLLVNPERRWKIQVLADEAGVSLGHVYNIKKLLADREWLRTELDGFVLSEPDQALIEWAQNYKYRRNQARDFYSLKSIGEIEAEVGHICQREKIPYALTGFSGAARLAPFVHYQRVTAYVTKDLEKVSARLDLKQVSSGANVSLLIPYDDGVLYNARDVDGIQVSTPVQVYLDLQNLGGRNQEAAQFLLEQVIQPTW